MSGGDYASCWIAILLPLALWLMVAVCVVLDERLEARRERVKDEKEG